MTLLTASETCDGKLKLKSTSKLFVKKKLKLDAD